MGGVWVGVGVSVGGWVWFESGNNEVNNFNN